ncbi:MAG TPA: sigma 54-interacting transcriptional regulator [Thermoanaerobaculia bacterium]|nr:sigma 54-interacting transcriptional regulator [Thermoanaerobaculia bacterium]
MLSPPMLRLVAYAPDGVHRYPLHRSELLIGSHPNCDIALDYVGVAQQHARLRYEAGVLKIEDLGSRRGTLVSGKRVKETELEVLDEIRVGTVTLLVEDVAAENPRPPSAAPIEELVPRITAEGMLGHLSRLSDWTLADTESRVTSESLVRELLRDFGGGVLFLLVGEGERSAIRLAVATDQAWLSSGEALLDQVVAHGGRGGGFLGALDGKEAWIGHHAFQAVERSYRLIAALPRFSPAGSPSISEALRAVGHLIALGLIHHVGAFEPILPGSLGQQDLVLDAGLVIGESPTMKRMLDELRAAVDPSIPVLLRGEAGLGKQLLAHSLHRSGPRRQGPFVVAIAAGARPAAIEADLFGSELAGRDGTIRREGKLLLANGGTLFLDDVDHLPLDVQARLVRFLRTGEVESADGLEEAAAVDVRLIAGSKAPLEEAVARDEFRVDLAYRLSRTTVDVPPLRDRKEDLPLLIQSFVNRFCHDTGTRLAGITVKAMTALLAYDYPGNLDELEGIARQMVYLCPAGRPVELSSLPEKVRKGRLQTARVDGTTDLDLDRLVGITEQAAIREALRRAHGNKSLAARMLGLSRNGLAIKMERFGI